MKKPLNFFPCFNLKPSLNKRVIVYLLLFFVNSMFSQKSEQRNSVFFKTGYNLNYYDNSLFDGFNLEGAYQYELFKQLTFEGFFNYTFITDAPSDLRNVTLFSQNLRRLNIQDLRGEYTRQNTYIVGVNAHYSFINTTRWYASFFVGVGRSVIDLKQVNVKGVAWNAETGEITRLNTQEVSTYLREGFIKYGFNVNYNFLKDFIIGAEFSATYLDRLNFFDDNDLPIYPFDSIFNVNLILGFKF